jgi:hypothetical protein
LEFLQHQPIAILAGGACLIALVYWLVLRRPRLSAEAIERARRERLARTGRTTDGTLVDTTTLDGSFLDHASDSGSPKLLLFRYRLAGVDYEAVQDVSALPDKVRDIRIDLPIQVRYDFKNPANSMVVAENWNGLRLWHVERPKPVEASIPQPTMMTIEDYAEDYADDQTYPAARAARTARVRRKA